MHGLRQGPPMTCTLLAAFLLAAPALAQDDPLDDLPEAESEEEPAPDEPAETDLLGDEESDEPLEPDGDEPDEKPGATEAAAEYRKVLNATLESDAEERLAAWEEYLAAHPDTPFLQQVSEHIAEAEEELYSSKIERKTEGVVDKRTIAFPEAVYLENLNPASRVRAGFEFGLPAWINVFTDVEYAIGSQFSSHVAIRHRYSGWSLELGPRFSPVKITDPDIVLTVTGDLNIGFDPGLLGLRPALLAGWAPIQDKLFVQIQGSPTFEQYDGFWTPRVRGGGNITFRAAEPVALFIEGAIESKYLGWPGGDLQFHTVGFGMRFYPSDKNAQRDDPVEAILGAQVPAFFNYPNFLFHEGAASVQGAFYLE